MIKQYTVICRHKTHKSTECFYCDGESEFKLMYKFMHKHPDYNIIEAKCITDKTHIFPSMREAWLFLLALCLISLVLFPVIIFIINCIVSIFQHLSR